MYITKDIISFAYIGNETEIDYIPLAEVRFAKEMRDTADFNQLLSGQGGQQDEDDESMHVVQIATEMDGHNSGRAYYVRAHSKESCLELLQHINVNAKAARRAAEAKNAFRRTQYRVRKIYQSRPFQVIVAIMICAVSTGYAVPHARPPRRRTARCSIARARARRTSCAPSSSRSTSTATAGMSPTPP
jgi:hypothetical protein